MRRRDLLEAGLASLLALLLYAWLGQETFYKVDGHLYLGYVLNGEWSYPRHFLYLPMVAAMHAATEGLGLTLYESARLLSAVGMAVGVGLFHLASVRLGLARGAARSATLLCATVAPVVFFATIVEVHGSFFAFAGLAALAAAGLAEQPGLARAALFGAASALAFCAHSTGALLPAAFLPLLLLREGRTFRGALAPTAVVAGTLVAGVLASPLLAKLVGVHFDLRHSGEFATDRAAVNVGEWWRWGATLAQEWVVPFLPMSALAPCLLVRRDLRARAAWLLLGVALYLVATIMILGGESERGAYLLPFAWPLALLAAAALPRPALVAIAAVQFGLAFVGAREHDQPAATRAFAAGARASAHDAPLALLVGDELDLKVLLLHLTDAERVPLFELARLPAGALDGARTALAARVEELLGAGRAVLLSEAGAARITSHPQITPLGPPLLAALRETFRFEPVADQGFTGWRVHRR